MQREITSWLFFQIICSVVIHSTSSIHASELPPRPSGPVADYAGIIDPATRLKINTLARTLWVEEQFGLIVATVPDIGSVPIAEYAAELNRAWGVGVKNNSQAALILIARKPPAIHILAGTGTGNYLNEAVIGRLIGKYGALINSPTEDRNSVLLMLTGELAGIVRTNRNGGTASVFTFAGSLVRGHPRSVAAAAGVFMLLFAVVATRKRRRPDYCTTAFNGIDSEGFGQRIGG